MITHVKINGMSCQHCVNAVFTALTPVPGISSAQVTIGNAVIEHDGRATNDLIRDAVENAGYQVESFEEEKRRLPVI
jgi:copper chaperone